MTTALPGPRLARPAFFLSVLLGLVLPLLTPASLAAGEDAVKGAVPPPKSGAATSAPKKDAAPGARTEGLAKPSGDTRPNPDQANPALLNPCDGNPQPKWCGE
jgi:hypothetical protein